MVRIHSRSARRPCSDYFKVMQGCARAAQIRLEQKQAGS